MKLINTNPPRFVHGFTLVELIITVFVASILFTVAVPSFQDTIRQNRLTTQANELITALNLARSEAIRRSQNVTVTPKVGGWNFGWVIESIDPATGLAEAPILRDFEALQNNLIFTGGPVSYTYQPSGFKIGLATDTYTLCDSNNSGHRGRTIRVSTTGRPRIDNSLPTLVCP